MYVLMHWQLFVTHFFKEKITKTVQDLGGSVVEKVNALSDCCISTQGKKLQCWKFDSAMLPASFHYEEDIFKVSKIVIL